MTSFVLSDSCVIFCTGKAHITSIDSYAVTEKTQPYTIAQGLTLALANPPNVGRFELRLVGHSFHYTLCPDINFSLIDVF